MFKSVFAVSILSFSLSAFAGVTVQMDAFEGKAHNYSKNFSNQLEITLNWALFNGWGGDLRKGQVSVKTDAQGRFQFPKVKEGAFGAETSRTTYTIRDLVTGAVLMLNGYPNDSFGGGSYTDPLKNFSIYDLEPVVMDDIRTRSGQSIPAWLKANKKDNLTGKLSISYLLPAPVNYHDLFKKDFYGKYEAGKIVINAENLPLIIFGADAGAKPAVKISVQLESNYDYETVYLKTEPLRFDGVVPASLYQQIIIAD